MKLHHRQSFGCLKFVKYLFLSLNGFFIFEILTNDFLGKIKVILWFHIK